MFLKKNDPNSSRLNTESILYSLRFTGFTFMVIQVMEEDLKALQWEHEVLEQRFEKIQSERDELYTKFVKVSQL